MMTWVLRLCALCAMSALMQTALPDTRDKGSIRLICGLLMLRLTLERIHEIGEQLLLQTELSGLFSCIMS